MSSQTYAALDKSWRSTCRVVLGDEVGGLEKYSEWLAEPMAPLLHKRSYLSGKDVCCAVSDYAEDARFISIEEADFGQKFQPLGINEIKDIDSIAEALQERFVYCGNVVLGNSRNVERSSDIQNSFHVYNSNFIYDCEHVAYSSYCRGSKYLFATISDYSCSHMIRAFETHKQSRCFEAWNCYNSSDCYFSSFAEGCQDAMFSFNVRNKRNVIGNIELPKERYLELKAKLLGEIREELERNGRLPSLMDIVASSAPPQAISKLKGAASEMAWDPEPLESAFQKTTGLLLGKPLHDLHSYHGWLGRHVPGIENVKSAVSGRTMHMSMVKPYDMLLRDRLVSKDECWEIGGLIRLDPSEIESFRSIKEAVGRIAYFTPEGQLGECSNLMMVPLVNTSVNCYYCPIASFNEYAAFSYWPRTSKYVFGSALAFSSNFCINSYYSTTLSRAFEADGCSNCSDVYFAHNCENVRDSMFCFNAKNLRNAIGNAPMAERYKSVKSSILNQIADELERNKSLRWDIFNIGARRSRLWHRKLMA
ncbi:MAG: hypothetical protein PHF60_05135 [Candidatus ainarchaeum sp.]|nr:hypothetical protein [Candidatus ainarchaeum sp.]